MSRIRITCSGHLTILVVNEKLLYTLRPQSIKITLNPKNKLGPASRCQQVIKDMSRLKINLGLNLQIKIINLKLQSLQVLYYLILMVEFQSIHYISYYVQLRFCLRIKIIKYFVLCAFGMSITAAVLDSTFTDCIFRSLNLHATDPFVSLIISSTFCYFTS